MRQPDQPCASRVGWDADPNALARPRRESMFARRSSPRLPMRGRDWSAALLCAAVAAALVLPDLGDGMLWQDEAQTALLAGTILDHGVPLGFDGRNHFSQELGKEYAANTVWRWHTWLS